jgi:predicted DNA-binding transcriptional regulator YafY
VDVAEPREVLWWALGWGADAEILEPAWLREEAIQTIRNMLARYQMEG